MKYFEISVQRICGEFTCGRVSREFYDYWFEREGEISLETHMLHLDDEESRDPNSPTVHGGEEEANGWYEIDDVIHINNAVTRGNTIHIDEVVPDEDSWTGYKYLADGYSEEFHFDDLAGEMPKGFCNYTRRVKTQSGQAVPENPVIVCKSIEKGLQTQVYVETEGDFDLGKLQFEIWEVDGDAVIAGMRYDGIILENHPDSSDGRAYYAYLGDLLTNEGAPETPGEEEMAALDEELKDIHRSFANERKGRPFIWSMFTTTLVLIVLAASVYFLRR